MGVPIEEEWRYKKVRSEHASRSAFAYKINQRLQKKASDNMSYGYGGVTPYSQEVILKVTGGARSQKGIKGAVHYISKNGQIELTDSNGIKYKTKEEISDAVDLVQSHVVRRIKSNTKAEKLTHNLMFSASIVAGVSKEDMLQATIKTLKEKYPHNYFVCAYHEDTKKPHMHVVLNIHQDNGKKIDIKNKDFHELRRSFCQSLVEQGYDLKASRRYGAGQYDLQPEDHEDLKRENRNVYEVVEFGSESYKADKRNSNNNYLVYKTSNGKEVTIWGKELLGVISQNNIQQGDFIKIEKVGFTMVKVPVYGDDRQTVISWKETKRNQWQVEKADGKWDFSKTKYLKEIKLDTPEQAEKQRIQREKFNDEKNLVLSNCYQKEHTQKWQNKLTHPRF